jgi:urea-proton symporter
MSSAIAAAPAPPLSQAVGYGIVVGVGALFALSMIFITRVLSKYLHEEQDSEMFSTANRSVRLGLISSAVVSSWTWPATLLTSATFAYSWGVSGSLWYGIGGSIQIFLFTTLALEIKRRAPRAHTVVEIIHVRYGKYGHFVYLFYSVATNILVTAMLLLGGAGAVSALTGMHIVA